MRLSTLVKLEPMPSGFRSPIDYRLISIDNRYHTLGILLGKRHFEVFGDVTPTVVSAYIGLIGAEHLHVISDIRYIKDENLIISDDCDQKMFPMQLIFFIDIIVIPDIHEQFKMKKIDRAPFFGVEIF